jgi:hypothetical protein
LDENGNLTEPRIQAIAEGKVDDPVFPAKRNGRFGSMLRERLEAFPFAPRKDHGENVVHEGELYQDLYEMERMAKR